MIISYYVHDNRFSGVSFAIYIPASTFGSDGPLKVNIVNSDVEEMKGDSPQLGINCMLIWCQ